MSNKQRNNRGEAGIATFLHAESVRLGIPLAGNFELMGRCIFSCRSRLD